MSNRETLTRRFLHAQNEKLDMEEIEVRLPDIAPGQDGFRIALVSDLHMADGVTSYHREILSAVRAAHPSLIAIGGDTIDGRTKDVPCLSGFFRPLAQIAPTVAILGNNDCLPGLIPSLRQMYGDSGVILLENETRILMAGGAPIKITGLSDPRAERVGILPPHAAVPEGEEDRHRPLAEALPEERDQGSGARVASIVLLHKPHLAREYAHMQPSLILAGHAHGGQFRLPIVGALFAPGQGVFPHLTSGLYALSGTQLAVSRGLGNHDFPFRIGNRPHLPVLVLRACS